MDAVNKRMSLYIDWTKGPFFCAVVDADARRRMSLYLTAVAFFQNPACTSSAKQYEMVWSVSDAVSFHVCE